MNYKLKIQYDGTRYNGWQRQGNTDNTIQEKIEQILTKMCGKEVEIDGAGRTDAGAHAKGQVANVRLVDERTPQEIKEYLNKYLPYDIGILEVEEVEDRFHSRLNAKEKVYQYVIGCEKELNIFDRKYLYMYEEALDIEKMRVASRYLIGEHDFKSFSANKKMKKSTVRNLYEINISKRDGKIEITYRGNGFLYNMVRILTGTLLEVGSGKREPEEMQQIIAGLDRKLAGATAPACGLTLLSVGYDRNN